MLNRRSFIGSILALGAAPAIVRADSLMRIVPRDTVLWLHGRTFGADRPTIPNRWYTVLTRAIYISPIGLNVPPYSSWRTAAISRPGDTWLIASRRDL